MSKEKMLPFIPILMQSSSSGKLNQSERGIANHSSRIRRTGIIFFAS